MESGNGATCSVHLSLVGLRVSKCEAKDSDQAKIRWSSDTGSTACRCFCFHSKHIARIAQSEQPAMMALALALRDEPVDLVAQVGLALAAADCTERRDARRDELHERQGLRASHGT